MKGKGYQLREITPPAMDCGVAMCPAVYEARNVTPKEFDCALSLCPAIYETVRNVTPEEFDCAPFPVCPGIHQTSESYLVIGKRVDAGEIGLAEKVVEGQVAIEVPRALITNRLS